MATFRFSLVAPERELFAGDVDQVDAPGAEGDFGVLAGHAPFMLTVRDGEILVYSSMTSVTRRVRVQGGFAEVNDRGLTVLAEHAEVMDGGAAARPARADH